MDSLAPDTDYACYVIAVNAAGKICSEAKIVKTSKLAPMAPTAVAVDGANTVDTIKLTWTPGTTAGAPDELFALR